MAILIPGVGSVEITGYTPGVGVVVASAGGGGEVSGTVTGLLTEAFAVSTESPFSVTVTAATSFSMDSSASGQPYWVLTDLVSVDESLSGTVVTSTTVTDGIGLEETLQYIASGLVSDGFDLTDTSTGEVLRLLFLSEAMSLLSQTTSTSTIYESILENLVLAEVAPVAHGLTASEALELADDLTNAIRARINAAETLTLTAAITNSFTFVGSSTDGFTLSDSSTPTLGAALTLSDGVLFVSRLPLGEDDYQMWVVNATNLGVTKYANMPFNSVAEHNGRTFGLMETGLYELTGDTDDEVPIEAYVRTGMLTFGTSHDKAIDRAYLYVKSDQDIYLKTLIDEHGARREEWYKITTSDDSVLRTRLLRTKRELWGVAWGFEVSNIDGGTLDLRGVEVVPVILRRKS